MTDREPIKADDAETNNSYDCGECGAVFTLHRTGKFATDDDADSDYPENYDVSCPLCGGFQVEA